MKVLAQFKSIPNYVDFCLPELKSLISMHGLDWREVFKHEFSAEGDNVSIPDNDTNCDEHIPYYEYTHYTNKQKPKEKLVIPQSQADIRHTSFRRFPFIFLQLPSVEVCQSIIQRAILLDVFIEIISEAHNYDDLIANVDHNILLKHNQADEKILFEVDPYNSHLTRDQIIERIEILTESLDMRGKIDLKNATKRFWVMERHIEPFTKQTDTSVINGLLDIFFGVEVARSKSCTRVSQKENFSLKYDLKNRVYLGPTSTDNILSFLMSNQGEAKQGSLVFDPFLGSGSLLIPPSHYGSICFGSDLDPRVLHGFGVGRINNKSAFYKKNSEYCDQMKPKIMLNFEQYELPKPTVIRMDCMNTNFRDVEVFDAIICDPPYGIRAMTRTATDSKQDKKKKNSKLKSETEEKIADNPVVEEVQTKPESVEDSSVESSSAIQMTTESTQVSDSTSFNEGQDQEEQKEDKQTRSVQMGGKLCYAQTISISVDSIVNGLVGLANRLLVPGGRLVFLYPIDRDTYNISGLADLSFPNFSLIDYSENTLSEKKSRILITLQKQLSKEEFQRKQQLISHQQINISEQQA